MLIGVSVIVIGVSGSAASAQCRLDLGRDADHGDLKPLIVKRTMQARSWARC